MIRIGRLAEMPTSPASAQYRGRDRLRWLTAQTTPESACYAKIGLRGSQDDGWTGYIAPEELTDIRVEETRRA